MMGQIRRREQQAITARGIVRAALALRRCVRLFELFGGARGGARERCWCAPFELFAERISMRAPAVGPSSLAASQCWIKSCEVTSTSCVRWHGIHQNLKLFHSFSYPFSSVRPTQPASSQQARLEACRSSR